MFYLPRGNVVVVFAVIFGRLHRQVRSDGFACGHRTDKFGLEKGYGNGPGVLYIFFGDDDRLFAPAFAGRTTETRPVNVILLLIAL